MASQFIDIGGSGSGGGVTPADIANTKIAAITLTLDGSGSAITTGTKLDLLVSYACTINSATLLADVAGSIVIDVLAVAYASYPPVASICGAAKPTLTAAASSQDTTLTGWTTSVAAGTTLRFVVDSASTLTRCTLVLKVTKT